MARKRLSPTPAEPAGTAPGGLRTPFPAAPEPAARRAPIADVAHDSAAAAALEEMAGTLHAAREEGRMVLDLPLEAIETGYLVRDRIALDEAEMEALTASLRARGQQTPIEVARIAEGRYGLISGWRRLTALRRLQDETGEARFGKVQALLRRPEHSAEAYLAMVEENEIRAGLSYYERARIVARAVEQGVFDSDRAALQGLFGAASRPRRSKIGSFLAIVRGLDGALRFPETLGERLGLALAKGLEGDPGLAARLRAALEAAPPASAEAEQARIAEALRPQVEPRARPAPLREDPVPGVSLVQNADGSLTLRGKRVDAALRAGLLDWLKQAL